MSFQLSEKHIADYHTLGYTVFEGILPPALITDLRREADKAREIAREVTGPQAQRLQPLTNYDLDIQPFKDYGELPDLNDAIHSLLTPDHYYADLDRTRILLEPANFPWCTNWHRDWRDHMPETVFEAEFRKEWDQQTYDIDYMNQINCALYEDPSTWVVPGSHYRQRNEAETTYEQRERDCLEYCQNMPGAVQLRLNPGDLALYRSSS